MVVRPEGGGFLILPDSFAQTDFRLFCLYYSILSRGRLSLFAIYSSAKAQQGLFASIVADGTRTEGGKIGGIPSASQGLDQEHAGIHAAPQDFDSISLVGELDRLCGDDLKVGVDATLVTIRKKLKGIFR